MRKFSMILAVVFSMSLAVPAVAQDEEMGTELFSVDVETGEFMSVGWVGDEGDVLTAFAIDTTTDEVGPAVGTTDENELIWFDVNSPDMVEDRVELTNIDENTMIVGIDYRPDTGELVALSADSVLHVIDEESGEVSPLEDGAVAVDPAIDGPELGFDFNPTADAIRIAVSSTQNLRVVLEENETEVDGELAYAEGDMNEDVTPRVVGAGYTNSVPDAEETELYVVDAETNALALQDPPNDGVLNTIGDTGVEVTDWTGMDIHPAGDAFATVPMTDEDPAMATPADDDMDDDMDATPDPDA